MASVIIVGGGLAGLSCAKRLHDLGVAFKLFDGADAVGGRVRTDEVDGFQLDRGFQVLLTAYPTAAELLDFDALELRRFQAGALIRFRGKFHRFADPWRQPEHLLATAFSPLASVADKLRVGRLRTELASKSTEDILSSPQMSSLEYLREFGFADRIIETFFRPFFGGVFLESDLATTCHKLQFVFKMFSEGYVAVPANGMQRIPEQLASTLPVDAIQLNSRVESITSSEVCLANGVVHQADAVVLAVDPSAASRLLGEGADDLQWNEVRCAYFAADKAAWPQPVLLLNGEGVGPINNLCTMTEAAPQYAADARHLISVSVLDASISDDTLTKAILDQACDWFGDSPRRWRHVKTYHIQQALPRQESGFVPLNLQHESGVIRCGDYTGLASIQSAMESGVKAAEQVQAMLALEA